VAGPDFILCSRALLFRPAPARNARGCCIVIQACSNVDNIIRAQPILFAAEQQLQHVVNASIPRHHAGRLVGACLRHSPVLDRIGVAM
jgi:hypothetical protein